MAENTEQRVTIEETKREGGTQIPAVEAPVVEIPTPEPVVELVPEVNETVGQSRDLEESKQVNIGIGTSKSFLAKALEKIQFRKRAKLEKVMKLAGEKKSITNDDVEKLLHVSDATATRYLAELVRQGRLRRIGVPQNPRYEPLSGSNGGN